MTAAPPANARIYHITHVENLPSIVREGCLWSDAKRKELGFSSTLIGYSHIKDRRMQRRVTVAAGGTLGEYVPFYFCPRAVMLYVIHKRRTEFQGGQEQIIHLVSTVNTAIGTGRPWAFTDRHAELAHALYFDHLEDLGQVRWDVMPETYWQDAKEERQAEFLVHQFCPWSAIRGIAAMTTDVAARVQEILAGQPENPKVAVRRGWYY